MDSRGQPVPAAAKVTFQNSRNQEGVPRRQGPVMETGTMAVFILENQSTTGYGLVDSKDSFCPLALEGYFDTPSSLSAELWNCLGHC